MDQAGFQAIAASQGAQGVFDYAKNNGLSLDQLAQIGGVSTQEMANLAQSQGINAGMLSQIGYQAPAPAPTLPPAPTKEYLQQLGASGGANAVFDYALANNLTMDDLARIGGVSRNEMTKLAMDTNAFKGESFQDAARVYGGQMVNVGTAANPTWVYEGSQGTDGIMDITRLTGGGGGPYVGGATLMNDPYMQAYSSAFARNNTNGGGFDFVNQMGGPDGFRKWVDAQPGGLRGFRASMGYQDAAGMIPGDAGYQDNGAGYIAHQNSNYASGNQPGQVNKTPTGLIGGNNSGTTGNSVTGQNPVSGGNYKYTSSGTTNFNPSTDTTRGQVNSILAEDSEMNRQAETAALQQMNARGLLNSSIANTAGRSAVIQNALAIGDPTANQYQKAKLTTQELDSRMDLANLDADTRLKIAELSNEESSNQNALGNYRAIAAQANDAINQILTSPTLTEDAKKQAINSVLQYHDEYLKFQDELTGLNLSGLVSYE